MSGSVNKVILVGNLGRDPESRTTQNGSRIVTMSVATSENWRDRESGERREKTEWHRVVVFNERIGEICEKYLRKGSKVYLEGSLQTRKWTGNDGQERYTTEVIIPRFTGVMTMLSGRSGGDYDGGGPSEPPDWNSPGSTGNNSPGGGSDGGGRRGDLDDEIPF